MVDRNFTNTGQLMTSAPDPATAQANMEAAAAAIKTALEALPGMSVTFMPEVENGEYVFQED